MSATCPKCSKPVRIGAKFCGSCGAEMPGTIPLSQVNVPIPTPEPEVEPAPVPQAEMEEAVPAKPLCPHCGKEVREGAKFCNFCGKPIAIAEVPTPAVPVVEGPVDVVAMEPPPPPPTPIPSVPPLPPIQMRKKKRGKKLLIVLLLLVLGVLCLVAVGVVLFFTGVINKDMISSTYEDVLGRIGRTSPTLEATETEQETETPEPTFTETTAPTSTSTKKPTSTPDPTVETVESTEGAFIFKDEFSTGINDWWTTWGVNKPVIVDDALGHLGITSGQPGDSGITTVETFTIGSNIKIGFIAIPQDVMTNGLEVDWKISTEQPATATDGTKDGSIHVVIGTDKQEMTIYTKKSDDTLQANSCSIALPLNQDPNRFIIEVKEDKVELYLDDQELCSVPTQPYDLSEPGWLSFSGNGILDLVYIEED